MRNLLDESSDAQSLDKDRLTGSLHFPVTVFSQSAVQTQEERLRAAMKPSFSGRSRPYFRNELAHSKGHGA
jgi:hypothetical protein